MPDITITNLQTELAFTEYHRRRGINRDNIRYKIYSNICKTLEDYNAFVTAYASGGPQYNEAIWEYDQSLMAPIAPYLSALYQSAQAIKDILESIERAAPGTFGIDVPPLPQPEEPLPEEPLP